MNSLFLEDLQGQTEEQVRQHLVAQYEAKSEHLDRFDILLGYESVGSWGCDSSSYFLLREKSTGTYFEFAGSHCSCYGFEGQYDPQPVTLDFLKSAKHYCSMGGYDSDAKLNVMKIKQYLETLQ